MPTIFMLLPWIKWIERLVFWLVRDDAQDAEEFADFELLEERFLAYPAIAINQSHKAMNGMARNAINQSHKAMNGMARNARKNIERSLLLMEQDQYSQDKFQEVLEKENLIDKYEDRLGTYLLQLTGKAMNVSQTKQVSKFLHTLSDFERLGDHAENIARVAQELYEKKMKFSERAQYEINVLQSAVQDILDLTVNAFQEDDLQAAAKVEPLRDLISVLCDELKIKHIERLRTGKCKLKQSFAFNDLLNNFERVAAHCSNIAVAMIELEAADFGTHAYLREVKGVKNADYTGQFELYEKKYDISKYKKNKKK